MKITLLYRVFLTGIGIVILIAGILWGVESSFLPKEKTAETAPSTSGLNEVEFETGALAKRLHDDQEARLNAYRGDPKTDRYIEVPIERAMDEYLRQHAREKP